MGKKIIIAFAFFLGLLLSLNGASADTISNEMIVSSAQSTASSSVQNPRILQRGMRGDDVQKLQETLRTISGVYPNGLVTGYFGVQTEAAVKRLQEKEKIVSSGTPATTGYGQVGPKTFITEHLFALEHNCLEEKESSRQSCLENYYEDFGTTYGVARALLLLDTQIKYEPLFSGTCHEVMHHIAHVAVHQYGTFGDAFLRGNDECQNGYYHGVVEEFLRHDNPDLLSADDIRNFCSKTANTASSSVAELNCVHGMGHALVYMTYDDLPRALIRCADFSEDTLRAQCATGAFMQHTFNSATSSVPVATLKEDPAFHCVQMAGNQDECWITLSATVISEKDRAKGVQFCSSLRSPSYRAKCSSAIAKL